MDQLSEQDLSDIAFAQTQVRNFAERQKATMTELAGKRSGEAGGVMNMGSNLGGLVSPALTPVLAKAIGWENALLVAAALSVVGGLLWLGVSAVEEA